MYSIGKVPNPQFGRIGLDGGRPLAVRFQEIQARAAREIEPTSPDYSVVNLMMSEQSIDLIYEALERAAARRLLSGPSPELREAWNEVSRLTHQYNEMVRTLCEARKKWSWQVGIDWRHKLLRSPDMSEEIPTLNTDWDRRQFPDVISARKRAKELHAQVKEFEEFRARAFNTMSFDSLEPGEQAVHLAHALYDDNIELKAHIAALEQQVGKLTLQIGRLQRSVNPPKRKAA